MNQLYFGDCLDVIRKDISDESIDLIYLDPPFNSKRLYNAFIGDAQWVAFNDTWRWHEAVDDFHEVAGDVRFGGAMEGLRSMLGEGPNLAYLSYMANRLRECWRTLKPTGSIYLHCDPTMSHYLKILMDGIATKNRFRNEIVWSYKRWTADKAKHPALHDIILCYGKTSSTFFNPVLIKNSKPNQSQYVSAKDSAGKTVIMRDRKGKPVKRETSSHLTVGDVWDIPIISPNGKERVGYPTQKPLRLLDRIINSACPENGLVLDPFCGCGTSIHSAQNNGRRWIGIDICVNACKVIEQRLRGHFDSLWDDVEFIGFPKTRDDAKTLASLDAFRFERWAASLVDGMEHNKIQRGDKGIDGRGRLAIRKGKFVDIVSQVKGGGASPGDVQAFNGARQQAGADLGIFTCFEGRVTERMRDAAASTGRFMDTPVVQIYTVEDYFAGRRPIMPKAA